MSLARAFTKRGTKKSDISAPSPQRGGMAPKHSFSVGNLRSKISAPVELLSTTNMLSYNAPDIHQGNASTSSDSESATTTSSTPPTSPDTSSIESSPTTVEPNHLSGYFAAAVADKQNASLPKHSASVKHSIRHSASTSFSTTASSGASTRRSASTRQSASSSISSVDPSVPAVPQRALSHTKKSHEVVSRKLSMSRMSSQKNSISTTRSSLLMFSSNVDTIAEQQPAQEPQDQPQPQPQPRSPPRSPARNTLPQSPTHPQVQSPVRARAPKMDPHPFGNELAKVSEIAEEFGVKDKMQVIDREEQEMISRGLFKFCAEDYIKEIQGLFVSAFQDAKPSRSAAMWI